MKNELKKKTLADWPPFPHSGATSFAGAAEETSTTGMVTLRMLVLSWQKEGGRSYGCQACEGLLEVSWPACVNGWLLASILVQACGAVQ